MMVKYRCSIGLLGLQAIRVIIVTWSCESRKSASPHVVFLVVELCKIYKSNLIHSMQFDSLVSFLSALVAFDFQVL
jgi:hypothetical protein